MFGDLFNEATSEGVQGPTVCVFAPAPPKPRHSCRFAGITNQGATCYLNSLLQTLLLTPEFKERLFALSEEELGSLQDIDKPGAKVRVIPIQLQRLFAQLHLCNQQSVSTLDLTNSFGWTNQEGFQQHDVQELNRILFCAIEESLVGTAGQNIINELYRGTFVNQIKCTRCKNISEREEDFLDLTLAIAGTPGVEAALKASYLDVEHMNGANQYRCETCSMLTDATKGAKLRHLPPILTLSLLRFSFDFVKMSRYKENGRFTFPMELDMSPYLEENSPNSEDAVYDLFSVVVHRGSAFGGHYFAYIRNMDGLGIWSVEEGKPKQKCKDPSTQGLDVIECVSPVDLVETILSGEPGQAMSMERLCAEISKETGMSWSKRFRKSHGPISKFLKSNTLFEYNQDSNWVSLAPVEDSKGLRKGNDSQSQSKQTHVSNPDSAEEKDSGYQESAPDDCWFCFNDSNVYPILTKQIEQQFSGKESAYMLFYRLRSLQRPSEAQGQPAYCIPDRFIKEVDAINEDLLKQRSDHDQSINSVNLRIYDADHFVYRELLHLKPDVREEVDHKELSIDKRRPVAELRTKIKEILVEKNLHNFNIHRMTEMCGGFHLSDELKDEEAVLQDLNISNDTCLFVWNGSVVDDQWVEEGPKHEPIKLLVLHEIDQQPLGEIVLRKSRNVQHLYHTVAEITGMQPDAFSLKTGVDTTDAPKPLSYDTQQSLSDVGLSNADMIILSVIEGNVNTQDQLDSQKSSFKEEQEWFITVQDKLSVIPDMESIMCNTLKLTVKASMGLKELKIKSMEQFNISDVSAETVRLREVHKTLGLQPPLREGLSLYDSGLSNGMTLVLESGRPPQDSEMTISVNKVVSGKLALKREFLVDRQLTVLGMLQAACKLMDCAGSQWYLSKTDIYGDPADPLDNDSATLLDLLINDGDTLVLQEGSIIKKDQVCLMVWLHKDKTECIRSNSVPGDRGDNALVNGDNEEDRVMLELAAKLSLNDAVNPDELNTLHKCIHPNIEQLFEKSLIINKSMSSEDLKQALMGTERFQTLRIPTSNFMRLRLLEGGRLKAVLRTNSQVIRHASPKETFNLGVQILPSEETLGVHELLLNVAMKIGGSRIYMPPKEFVWNTSGGQGASNLRRAIANRLSLPAHDVSIAKYNPGAFSWTVLKDLPQFPSIPHMQCRNLISLTQTCAKEQRPKSGVKQVRKTLNQEVEKISTKAKGKRKSGGGKTNIRQAPYYVQDGDLIGIKVISSDKGILEPDDFCTQEDIESQVLLQQIAEEKRRKREEKKNDGWFDGLASHNSRRRPEVPLTIKVDKFS